MVARLDTQTQWQCHIQTTGGDTALWNMMVTMATELKGQGGLLARLHWNHVRCKWWELSHSSSLANPLALVCLPHFVEQLHHLIIDDKHNGHVQTDPAQAGDSAFVECPEPLIPQDLQATVQCVPVFVCL